MWCKTRGCLVLSVLRWCKLKTLDIPDWIGYVPDSQKYHPFIKSASGNWSCKFVKLQIIRIKIVQNKKTIQLIDLKITVIGKYGIGKKTWLQLTLLKLIMMILKTWKHWASKDLETCHYSSISHLASANSLKHGLSQKCLHFKSKKYFQETFLVLQLLTNRGFV